MRLAYVVPRYGDDVIGGAETAVRRLAERLVAGAGWDVEVLTTCARDDISWASELPPGDSELNGVRVRRFACQGSRAPQEYDLMVRVLGRPHDADPDDAERWIDVQGPTSPELIEAVAASDADVVAFSPYLFHPTVRGVPRVAERAVIHPAAHDEPALRLPVYDRPFRAARAFVYYTHEERRLVERRFSVAHRTGLVLGLGVDEPPDGDHADPGELVPAELGGRPFLLYVGRVQGAKGTVMLARYFAAYKERHPGPLAMVFAGPADRPEELDHPDVVVTGVLEERVKWALLRRAAVLVAPSPFESFSLALMEAWTAGTPVLVNGRCAVTRGHCRRSGGGLWFEGFRAFEAALERLLGDDALREALAGAGRAYVERHYRWPVLVERYRVFVEGIAGRG